MRAMLVSKQPVSLAEQVDHDQVKASDLLPWIRGDASHAWYVRRLAGRPGPRWRVNPEGKCRPVL